jgi:P27 family predicted phage terminase small subunit
MARRGPPPQPTALKLLKGNPGKRRIDGREPRPPLTTPSCPRWLSAEAKRAWRETVPVLRAMRILARIDRDALAAYCQAYARWKAAEQFLDQHGDVYPIRDESGKIKYMQAFPQVFIARSQLQVLRSYQQEFGMTPSARTRVHEIASYARDPEIERFFGPQPAPRPYQGRP